MENNDEDAKSNNTSMSMSMSLPVMPNDPSSSSANEGEMDNINPDIIMDPPSHRVKRFVFRSKALNRGGGQGRQDNNDLKCIKDNNHHCDSLEVIVHERLHASYGLYVWPSAPILAWYLYEHRSYLPGKQVLELGAGTGLPGVVAAMCGASVTLTDSSKLTHCLDQCRKTAEVNGVADKVKVMGLTWGLFLSSFRKLKGQVDLLLGSDCFYDPVVFEDLVSTVAYILEANPKARFLTTYQERSSDWSIEHLLRKWSLKCRHVPLNGLANSNQIDLLALMQDHTIHLLEITLAGHSAEEEEAGEDDDGVVAMMD